MPLSQLRDWGIRGVVLDLDNTIVPWHTSALPASIMEWVAAVKTDGIRLCLLTNNYGAQAKAVAAKLDIPIVKGALKPWPPAFRRSLATLDVDAGAVLGIGDQLFTDVLGAKLMGMRAVVVRPIGQREFPTTKILRALERPVYARLRRNGVSGA